MNRPDFSGTEGSLLSDANVMPGFETSHLPMAITLISGHLSWSNRAFNGFLKSLPGYYNESAKFFEFLSSVVQSTPDYKPGIWYNLSLAELNYSADIKFSFSDFKDNEGNSKRLFNFIQMQHNVTEIPSLNAPDSLVSRFALVLSQFSSAGWEISYNDNKAEINTWNFFELLAIKDPGENITPDDLLHRPVIHPDDLKDYDYKIERFLSQKVPSYSISYRTLDRNGITRHFHCHARLQYNQDGDLKHWTAIVQDVSSFKKSESLKSSAFQISQLIHSQHNLELLMKAIQKIISSMMPAPEMTITLLGENDERIIYAFRDNTVHLPVNGKSENGLIDYVLLSGDPLLATASSIELMMEENIIALSKPIPQSWLGIPLKTRESTIGVLSLQSHTDETTYSEDEKIILQFVAEQIALAIQKIRSEEQLVKAKNTAENSSRLKSSLLANMSHELRTPMTGILGFSEILNEELEDPRLKSMAGTIFKSAGRLMSTLNSIIDLSALEADKNSLNLKPINTRLMFQPLLKVAYSVASDKGLYLRTALPPDLLLMADEKLLSQMLHHLIDNALKFTVDGGISISAYKMDKKSTEGIIRISDTGIGIAPEHHKMIFEEFRQVSEGFSRTFEGSGLGLSLCSKIARLLNARVWVESVVGKGSDFYVELPLAKAETVQVQAAAEEGQVITTHRLSRGSVPEVLIVEDNEINRRLAALYLRELCNTEMAENGYVALEKIKRRKYDAILMDINLGAGPDGLSIAHQIKDYELNKNTPVIAVTGYTMHGDKEKLLSNGCSHYLPKPYDKQTLLKLFSGILYGQQTSSGS